MRKLARYPILLIYALASRLRQVTWVDWTAAVLLALAVAFVWLWHVRYLVAWDPNAATALTAIALTIAIVDRIVQNDTHAWLRPGRVRSRTLPRRIARTGFASSGPLERRDRLVTPPVSPSRVLLGRVLRTLRSMEAAGIEPASSRRGDGVAGGRGFGDS
jgi:hypothetical protein